MHTLRLLFTLLAGTQNEVTNKKYNPIVDWEPPSQNEILQTRQRFIEPMKSLTSSIFFSTDADTGERHETLKYLSKDDDADHNKPILFVSNHQLVGIDSWLVVNEIWESGTYVRAMTHPFLSNVDNEKGGFTLPGGSFYKTFGCLPVSPRTFYKLMKSNQPTLLFPGGARESFHKANEQYTLTAWSEESDFVRTAAKFNATIIPFSSVGAAESAFFLDQLPFADAVMDAILQVTPKEQAPFNARYDATKRNKQISFPIVVPKPLPSRHYFLFDKPIDLSNVDYNNKIECQEIYQNIKESIKQGCTDLIQAKNQDPYYDPLKRVAYEQLMRKQAPTFPINLLNL